MSKSHAEDSAAAAPPPVNDRAIEPPPRSEAGLDATPSAVAARSEAGERLSQESLQTWGQQNFDWNSVLRGGNVDFAKLGFPNSIVLTSGKFFPLTQMDSVSSLGFGSAPDAVPSAFESPAERKQRQEREATETRTMLADVDAAKALIANPNATAGQKFDAIRSLVGRLGHDGKARNVEIPDADGKVRTFDMEVEKAGGRGTLMVHAWEKTGENKEQHTVAFRAVYRPGEGTDKAIASADGGHYEHERSGRHEISFTGRQFARRHQGEAIAQFGAGVDGQVTPPVVPPDKVKTGADVAPPEPPPKKVETGTDVAPPAASDKPVTRTMEDQKKLYLAQTDGFGCSAFSLEMAVADWGSRKPTVEEAKRLERTPLTVHPDSGKPYTATVAGSGRFPGNKLEDMAGFAESQGLNAKPYNYNKVGPQTLKDLNAELDQGHTALARIVNPTSGNGHWIYIAGRSEDGKYIIADPSRRNNQPGGAHSKPVSGEQLLREMDRGGAGFAAVWGSPEQVAARRGQAPEAAARTDRALEGATRTGQDGAAPPPELKYLKHSAGPHGKPDALVQLPANFDPSKPINLVVFNHGFGSTVSGAYDRFKLGEQMKDAPPNTVLVMPEWQAEPGARNSRQGHFAEPGMFRGMLQEVFDTTDGLKGKTLKDVGNISIIAHSAGNVPSQTELYKNDSPDDRELSSKINNVTLLDALYKGDAFDKWITDNAAALRSGAKTFQNIFFDSTGANSRAQAARVERLLNDGTGGTSPVHRDYGSPRSVLTPEEIAAHPVIFKYSSATAGKEGTHMSMPILYVGPVEAAEALRRQRQ